VGSGDPMNLSKLKRIRSNAHDFEGVR